MYTYSNEDETNKNLRYVYIILIFIMLVANGIGQVYINMKSEKEEKNISKSLGEYESMSPDEADEAVQKEIIAISNNAKIFLNNVCIEGIVAAITTMIVGFFGWLSKGIVKIAETDNGYSKYSLSIIEISWGVAGLEVIGNVKGILDNIDIYRQVMERYYNIYQSLFGILSNIQNQIIK